MIDMAIGQLAVQLNLHLRRNFHTPEDVVVLSNLQEHNGNLIPLVNNRLVLFLSGIERDTAAHRLPDRGGAGLSNTLQRPAPVHLNLLVMCAANFSGSSYPEALKFLSAAIAYFQSHPVLDHHNTPGMDPRLERLVLSIENLSSTEMHNLWSIHASRYLPSVLYRVRMISLDADHVTGREPAVTAPDVRVAS